MAGGDGTTTASEARYKIGEVCRIADVQPFVLRYWETEFPVLAPDRSMVGPRSYTARELKIVERVKELLYTDGYTIAGAKKQLERDLSNGTLDSGAAEEPETPRAAPVPPPLPKPPSSSEVLVGTRPKRGRNRLPEAAPLEDALVFEETVSPAAPAETEGAPERAQPTTAAIRVDTGTFAPPPAEDPRLARIVAELREIATLLAKEPEE